MFFFLIFFRKIDPQKLAVTFIPLMKFHQAGQGLLQILPADNTVNDTMFYQEF